MQQSENNHSLWLDQVEDSEWKPRDVCTANISMHGHKHFRAEFYDSQRIADRTEELVAKTRALVLIPVEASREIVLKKPVEYDRQTHRVRRTSAKTCSKVNTSFGFSWWSLSAASIADRWASLTGIPAGVSAKLSQINSTRRSLSSAGSFRISATSASLMADSL